MAEVQSGEKKRSKERRRQEREEFELLAETRDPKLRDKIITDHLYIAEILAKKYINRGIEYEDLFQVASLALIYAVDRYDVSKGYAFSSFATPTIVGELKRHFRDKGWVIRVPRRIQELSKRINSLRLSMAQEMQKQATVDDIAERMGVSVEEVLEAMEASRVYSPQSLEKSLSGSSDEQELNLGDVLGVEDENYANIDFYDVVERLMKGLNDLEKKIFVYRYYDKRTQISIAKELEVSQMTVSRIEKKIINKFRQELHIKPEDLRS